MIIKYKYANGDVEEVEVSEELGTVISNSRRVEMNSNRKHRYHCYSIDTDEYKDKSDFALRVEFDFDCDSEKHRNHKMKQIHETFDTLTDIQRSRLKKYMSGMTVREIAAEEGVHHRAIEDSINLARKKFEKFL